MSKVVNIISNAIATGTIYTVDTKEMMNNGTLHIYPYRISVYVCEYCGRQRMNEKQEVCSGCGAPIKATTLV
jgi:ribosomal protein L37E